MYSPGCTQAVQLSHRGTRPDSRVPLRLTEQRTRVSEVGTADALEGTVLCKELKN